MNLDAMRAALLEEIDLLEERGASLRQADWHRPVRCDGWSVMDLMRHVSRAPAAGAESLRRLVSGMSERPLEPVMPPPDPDLVMAALRDGRGEIAGVLPTVTEAALANAFPLFFITVPGPAALPLMIMEVGTHRNDLDWAVGDPMPLPRTVVEAASFIVPRLLISVAGAASKPGGPAAYRLTGSSVSISLSYDGAAWTLGEPGSIEPCEIAGDDSSILLFALGRIAADDPSLKTSGDDALAQRFKTYFPGP